MLTKLRLERFKNFQDVELSVGPFTVLVGTNASGKSNLRDAFRFLHGISRGYTLAEIIGEKWIEGGVLQWRGIRGGTREVAYRQSETFALEASFKLVEDDKERLATYRIEVSKGDSSSAPRVVRERLAVEGRGQYVFDSHPNGMPVAPLGAMHLPVALRKEARKGFVGPTINFANHQPVLTQILSNPEVKLPTVRELVKLALGAIESMRFLDLAPDAMRLPSLPGQVILGDRGENLSSVLQAICMDPGRKQTLVRWVQRLTPMDAFDFEFVPDAAGRILVHLVEANGQKTSAYSASDGTLRFLAMIAALLGPEPARFYFFEELENGIHPTRLHLLLQLIEQKVSRGGIQMVVTSHSPQLLGFLSPDAQAYTSLIYRLPDQPDARIRRILDIPDAARLLEKGELGALHASGWMENAVFFTEGEEEAE